VAKTAVHRGEHETLYTDPCPGIIHVDSDVGEAGDQSFTDESQDADRKEVLSTRFQLTPATSFECSLKAINGRFTVRPRSHNLRLPSPHAESS
jgi:hypothetical protein